ncbi:MAG TPA: Crp/Fnr family transcriptional regulator [Xanthobacteraceae bacterium]|nr:Crp/Fnr family transcriptional regulator [Xanthobacteraceae bacterium]
MISREHLAEIAHWARDLSDSEIEQARRGIVEKTFPTGSYICHRGDRLDSWTGVVNGLVKMGTVSKSGKDVTFTGLRTGGWFGEGTILKGEPRRYDIVALRGTRMALMSRATFLWLFEHSVAFNRFLVRQLNERLGQFIAVVEYDRTLEATERVARNIAWLFNPVLFPGGGTHLEISQEELGLLCGISRQATNKSLQILENKGLLRVERGGITVLDLARLAQYGE